MNILIGCETSGQVREAFRKLGHNVWSCDIRPAQDGGQHIQREVLDAIKRGPSKSLSWDLIIAHPPCTALCVSGNHKYSKGKIGHQKRRKSVTWTTRLWLSALANAERVCFENPRGVLSNTIMGKASQSIQPYQFGHDASKTTDLWLYNLPKLKGTNNINPRWVGRNPRWANQTDSGQNRLGPSIDRWRIRSQSYSGIAEAMAQQWGNLKG